ncbi:MAG: ABC transporter permease [Micrococcales bacterium]|nr:ABC transporter permease [Micrococcales bacterium]
MAGREIIVRVTNKFFIVSTIVTLLLMAGFAGFSTWQSQRESTYSVAVTAPAAKQLVSEAGTAAHALDDKVTVTGQSVADDAAARQAVKDGDVDAWLHEGQDGWVLTSKDAVDRTLSGALQDRVRTDALTRNAAAAGTSITELEKGTTLTTDRIDGTEDNDVFVQVATFAFAILFYLAAMMFGQQIAGSVVEEKESRLVEIIATAIPLRQLLAGKVIGNSIIALGQVVLFSAVGLVALSFTDFSTMLPSLSGAVGWFIAFFAVGFLALACLFAVGGALASRNEDLASTTGPITIVLILVYFISFGLSGTAQVVASYVPIVSVISMPARVLAGGVMWWEPIVALVIMGCFAAVTVWLAEKVYRRSLMQNRGKLSWRQALATEE